MRQILETPVAVKGVRRKSPEKAAKMTRAVLQILETLAGVKGAHRNSREEAARRAREVRRIQKALEVLEGVRRKGHGQRAGTKMEYAKRGGNFVRTTAGGMLAWNVAGRAFAFTNVEGKNA